MWTAKIEGKNYNNGVLMIGVIYSNGLEKFTESIDMTGGSTDVLNIKIKNRIDTLNASANLLSTVQSGDFTPTTKSKTNSEAFVLAYNHFQSCKRALDIGLITSKDQVYLDAFSNLQEIFDVSLINLI